MKNLDFEWLTDEFMLYCRSTQLREKTMSSYEQTLPAINDQDLAAVSGGSGDGVRPSPYSFGQRIRVLLNTALGEMVLIGTITECIRMGSGTYSYSLTLDAPAPNGEINIFCFEHHIQGLA